MKLHMREGSTEFCSIYRILYGWEKSCLQKKTTKATKTQWAVDVQTMVGGDGGPYVVMEHMPKPQQKLR